MCLLPYFLVSSNHKVYVVPPFLMICNALLDPYIIAPNLVSGKFSGTDLLMDTGVTWIGNREKKIGGILLIERYERPNISVDKQQKEAEIH